MALAWDAYAQFRGENANREWVTVGGAGYTTYESSANKAQEQPVKA